MTKSTRTFLAFGILALFITVGFIANKKSNPDSSKNLQSKETASLDGETKEASKEKTAKSNYTQKPDSANSNQSNVANSETAGQSTKAIVGVINTDIVLGSDPAPVTVIEYASLSCPHCATFYNEGFKELKKDYIDTNKVKFVYRDFPLNQPALAGAMVALCHAEDNKQNQAVKYYDFLKVLFKTQDSWAFSEEFIEKLRSIAKLTGMTSDRFESCINNSQLQEQILKNRINAINELSLKSTPTFVVNGSVLSGYGGFDEIKKAIDQALGK